MLTHKNELTVPEVSCHSREEIEGGTIVRYLIRQPGETEWWAAKLFRPAIDPDNQEGSTIMYWIRWQSATDAAHDGPRIGPFNHRRDAEAALLNHVRAAADALEHGTGKAGVWTSDGALYRGDLDDRFLGRYVIEQVAPEEDAPQSA